MSFMSYIPGKKIYIPRNPEKFTGKYVMIRSRYEENFAKWCDKNPGVVNWSSEQIAIPYYDPTYRKVRRYYPDFAIRVLNNDGSPVNYIVEIKPTKEVKPPKLNPRKKKETFIKEMATYRTNQAKWKAAEEFCSRRGMKFKIITEEHLAN